MIPNLKRIMEFKKREIKRVDPNEVVLLVKSSERVLEGSDEVIQLSDIFFGEYSPETLHPYSRIFFYDDVYSNVRNEKRTLLRNYINGTLQDTRAKKVMELKEAKYYLLLTQQNYFEQHMTEWLTMRGIISLPKSLYLLYLLENGQFNKLIDEDIEEQFRLYDYEHSKTLDLNDIRDIYNTGLVQGSFDYTSQTIETGAKILNKVMCAGIKI